MPINYEAIAAAGGLGKGKSRTALKAERDREWQRLDEKGSAEAKARANGRCEIWIDGRRCERPDAHTHHQIGGSGKRGRNDSALAIHKQRACWKCHELVQQKTKVRRIGGEVPHYSDRYRSLK